MYLQEPARSDHTLESVREGYRVRLPRAIGDEDVGLGDVLKRATSAIGVRPSGGCERRAAALNRWLVFPGRHLR
jgi:hypothetical protein